MTTPHEQKRSSMTLGRREKEKKKRRKKEKREMKKFDRQLFNARCRRGNKISFSFNKSIRYRTRWVRKKRRRRYTSSQASQARFGKGAPEAAPSCELLFPSLSFSIAFSSACNSSHPISPHSVSEVPTLARKVWEDRKSTRLNSSHSGESRMPSSA